MTKKNKTNIDSFKKEVEVALVLGGGGVKGAAHVGVAQVLMENKIPISLLVGSSMGSFIAAGYQYYNSWEILLDKFLPSSLHDFVDPSLLNMIKIAFSKTGFCDGNNLQKMIRHQLPDIDIKDSNIPMILMATDLNTFEPYEMKSGNLIDAVIASTAIPPFYKPVEFQGKMLIDGAVCSPLPTDVAKKYGAKVVIASDISSSAIAAPYSNLIQLTYNSLEIAYYQILNFQRSYADILIHPKLDFPTMGNVDFRLIYETGKKAAQKELPKILQALKENNIEVNDRELYQD